MCYSLFQLATGGHGLGISIRDCQTNLEMAIMTNMHTTVCTCDFTPVNGFHTDFSYKGSSKINS